MDYFDDAMDVIAEWEGGWSDHKSDPGGLTRWGWTLKTLAAKAIDVNLDGRVDAQDLRDMTRDDARDLYRVHFWDAIEGDELPGPLAMLVFNSAVNQGARRAAKFLQRAAGAKEDGVIGPNTLDAADVAWMHDPAALMREFLTAQMLHYTSLAIFATFGRGWVRRTMDLAILAAEALALDTIKGVMEIPEPEPAPEPAPAPEPRHDPARPRRQASSAWRRVVGAFFGGGA